MTETVSRDEARAREVATVIVNQIPAWLRGAVGMTKRIAFTRPADGAPGLRFDCRGRGPYIVEVVLDEGADLYDVKVWTKSRSPRAFVDAAGIDVEAMVDIVDRIDRGALAAS